MKSKKGGNVDENMESSTKKETKTTVKANQGLNTKKKIVHSAQAQTKIVHIFK